MTPVTDLVKNITKHIKDGNKKGSKDEVNKIDDEKK